jgi:predicted permease
MDDFIPTGSRLQGRAGTGEFDSAVGTDYFTTMGIPIMAGRSLTAADTASSPRVAVVNEALSRKYFADQNAIGRTFTTTDARGDKLLYTIVGICGNIRYSNLRRDPPPLFFLSYHQLPDVPWGMRFAVRTRMPLAGMAAALRTAVQSVDRDLPLIDLRTQKEQIDQITMSERLLADLAGGFGVLALVLAAIGIYGVLAYSVSRRTSEIGIRMALGARPATVLGMVLREAAWIAAVGAVGGTAAALAMGKLVSSLLYGLKPWDPATLVGSAVLLGLVALGASWIPAHRAATVDPTCALRHE